MNDKVLNQLMKLTATEKKRLKYQEFYDDVPKNAYAEMGPDSIINNFFFEQKKIYISRHNRFSPYPTHSHTFLEINYMLRGSCDEIVNSTSIHLNQGDILLIDIGCPHSIDYLGSGDLLINILFQDTDINIDLLRGMKSSKSVLYKFMLDRKTSQKTPEPFLLLSQLNDPSIIETLDKLIEEYYLQREFSETIISSYLSILIAQMTRSFTVQSSAVLSKSQVLISDILLDIDNNFKTITLKQTAQKYGYNKNYLSNLFKITLGNSFSEVLNQKRIMQAHSLLQISSAPISTIIKEVGISNKSYFYSKYKKMFNHTPGTDRDN